MFSQINFGIKGGINYCKIDIDNSSDSENNLNIKFRTGYHFGLFTDTPINNRISVNTELLFSDKGVAYDKAGFIPESNVHLYYINLPVLLGYNLTKTIKVQAGLEAGYLLKSILSFYNNSQDYSYFFDKDFSLDYIAGIEYSFSNFGFGIRYEHSLINVVDLETRGEDGKDVGDSGLKNSNLQAYFAYKL